LGIDVLYIPDEGDDESMIIAAGLSAVTTHARIAAEVSVTPDTNPVLLAERAAVCDQILGGRLILVLRGESSPTLGVVTEAVAQATLSRPFVLAGDPATITTVTPSPAQPVLPIWVSGTAGPDVASAVGVSFVGDVDDTTSRLGVRWSSLEAVGGPWARLRLNRPARRRLEFDAEGELAVAATVGSALADRDEWGMDVVIFVPPAGLDWTDGTLAALATRIRPRLQMNTLPPGIEEFWDETVGERPEPNLVAPYALETVKYTNRTPTVKGTP
jgi:hypothetical protein